MDLDELLSHLDELKKALIESHSGLHYVQREIEMWRNRFLLSLSKEDSIEKGAALWAGFLYMPAQNMMERPPEETIKYLKMGWDEINQK